MSLTDTETIAALATGSVNAGLAVIRVSGLRVKETALWLTKGKLPDQRMATFTSFYHPDGHRLDEGILIYFEAPHSYTGEDVIEIQCHGSQVVVSMILDALFKKGIKPANPGEFTQRAFLNGRLDLTQAEAVQDLIHAQSERAAANALRALSGQEGSKIMAHMDALTELRKHAEAAIDFVDEDILFLGRHDVQEKIHALLSAILHTKRLIKQGILLQSGAQIALVGPVNAGKSTLMNALTEAETAIVTHLPGTTRDVLRERILLDGIPLRLVDTAGLRKAKGLVEQKGIERVARVCKESDLVIFVLDAKRHTTDDFLPLWHEFVGKADPPSNLLLLINKIDLLKSPVCKHINETPYTLCALSLQQKKDVHILKKAIKKQLGLEELDEEQGFTARKRHLCALEEAEQALQQANTLITQGAVTDLLAEALRQAQFSLGSIVGTLTSDDLLGKIFSDFCIGK
jgi:tRNA modification GTPase